MVIANMILVAYIQKMIVSNISRLEYYCLFSTTTTTKLVGFFSVQIMDVCLTNLFISSFIKETVDIIKLQIEKLMLHYSFRSSYEISPLPGF